MRIQGLKLDEVLLWNLFGDPEGTFANIRDAAAFMGMHPKRAYYLACKWSDKNVYEWGTSWDLGWKEQGDKYGALCSVEALPIFDDENFVMTSGNLAIRRPTPMTQEQIDLANEFGLWGY